MPSPVRKRTWVSRGIRALASVLYRIFYRKYNAVHRERLTAVILIGICTPCLPEQILALFQLFRYTVKIGYQSVAVED